MATRPFTSNPSEVQAIPQIVVPPGAPRQPEIQGGDEEGQTPIARITGGT